jgi:uncharacterized protein
MLTTVWLLVAALAIALTVLWLLQRRLIYFPLSRDVQAAASVLPTAEELSLETSDGVHLGAWFVPAEGATRGTVLVFNGNAGDRSYRAPLAAALAHAGLSVLLFDYRGYGGNAGNPSEQGLAADARAARAYLDARHDVDSARIVYFGESLGAAVAVGLALEHPPAALVLRSPFSSLQDIARVHYPLLPAGPLLRDRFDSVGRIGRLGCPVLIVAGSRDTIVPPDQSRRLFDAVRSPKHFALIAGAEHNDVELLTGPRLLDEVDRFLRANGLVASV